MKPRRALTGLLFSTCLAARLPTIPSPDNNQVPSIEVDVDNSRNISTAQQNAPGNLVRLSQYRTENVQTYEYDRSAGQGITVYVLDGGVRLTHEEFEGRATFGAGFASHQGVNTCPPFQYVHDLYSTNHGSDSLNWIYRKGTAMATAPMLPLLSEVPSTELPSRCRSFLLSYSPGSPSWKKL